MSLLANDQQALGEPERRLMLAVLEDAMGVLASSASHAGARRRRLALEVEEWMVAGDTSWPFSFLNICDALGLDAAAVRHRLLV